ncbi:MAG: DUF2189 domain-containing protein [Hyphomonadaceae bacterium]|nr:DUF2189 domain-containing protein [Hyphomonadaceae bacterium]
MTEQTFKLPDVATVSIDAPFHWLSGAWQDYLRAPLPFMMYGIALAGVSAMIAWALVFSGAFAWVFVLAGGFFLIAPVLAMGLYEGGRMLEEGHTPGLTDIVLVRSAIRLDIAYLGLALFLIYLFWTRLAQIVYALSTPVMHKEPTAFLSFMFTTVEGMNMAITGSIIGGVVAFIAFSLVVISAPMMLGAKTDVFIATITSVRSVTRNFVPMLIWAVLIAGLTAIGIATAFFGLILVFPLIGLATWRAYRELVPGSPEVTNGQVVQPS